MNAGPGVDMFTETLTTVLSIDRATTNEIGLALSGTVNDTEGLFTDAPVLLMLTASHAGGPGDTVGVEFTNTSRMSSVPEPPTWIMMSFGFAALGYAATRRGNGKAVALPA
jgi:hypothetical protein